jgi:tRNA U34 2-thiouridine synthase MnmA/TrmU
VKPAFRRRPVRAVILLSGGLDSTLAARMMQDQGIELFALHFTSPFCTCSRNAAGERGGGNGAGCRSQAQIVAGKMGIPIRTVAKGMEYMDIVRNPKHGRGSAMNPCVDCRIFTLRKGREYMEEIGASFLVTGEVVGQRPMSQRVDALRVIEKHSGCAGLVLRPLSALNLEPTIPEREGWVDRKGLQDIAGRSRKEQMRLAQEWNVADYPCPAGGCLLTDKTFSVKVKDLFDHCPSPDMADLNLLKVGRHFRMPDGLKVIVGRDEAENRKIEALGRGKLRVYIAEGFSGPSIGIEGTEGEAPVGLLARFFTRYGKPGTPPPFRVREATGSGERLIHIPADTDFAELERALLC